MPLEIQERREGSAAVLVCRGRVVFGEETSQLREKVKAALSGTPFIVLNVAEVRDIDSGGVGTLVALFTSAQSAGGDLKLVKPAARVAEVLRITKLSGIFSVYASEEDAVKACGQPARRVAS